MLKRKRINVKTGEKLNYNFQKLTPLDDIELNIYKDAFNYIFDNKDVSNVAISGPYCSGKSSVIRTYEKESDKQFMYLSVAELGKDKSSEDGIATNSDDPKIDKSDRLNIIEGKLLNSLIQQVKSDLRNQSCFQVREKTKKGAILIPALEIVTFIVGLLYAVKFELWVKIIDSNEIIAVKDILKFSSSRITQICVCLILIGILFHFFYSLIRLQKNRRLIKSIGFLDYNVQLFQNEEDYVFDKYLDEIIYLFENSEIDVVVIEDIDRFENNQIFVRLREINKAIQLRKKKNIKFFFLIRDDIFISKDRVKFFDFIVPIVPVIDSTNSFDKLVEHFQFADESSLNKSFLHELSLYIDDMRILKNIVNEYVFYHSLINNIELNTEKLLAMITYKNIFPYDYSRLQAGDGYVHEIINGKERTLKKAISKIDQAISLLQEEKEEIEKDIVESIDELNFLYFEYSLRGISVNNKNFKQYTSGLEFTHDVVNNIEETSNPEHVRTLIADVEKNEEYIKRKERILGTNKKHNIEINRLIQEKNRIQNYPIKRIMNRDNIESIFTYENENDNFENIINNFYFPLIKFLIRNGYIDETYSDYMNYFYGAYISQSDKIFWRSITDQDYKGYDYKIDNPELILSNLSVLNFEEQEVLNKDLLEYLFAYPNKYENFINSFLVNIKDGKNLDFFIMHYKNTGNKKVFITKVYDIWDSLLNEILYTDSIDDEDKKKILLDTFSNCTEKTLRKINKEHCIDEFIQEEKDFSFVKNDQIDSFVSGLKELSTKILDLEGKSMRESLLGNIYQNRLFELNYDNILFAMKYFYDIKSESELLHMNYSLILKNDNQTLSAYVDDNIEGYIKILNEKTEYYDDYEDDAIKLINDDRISLLIREEYLDKYNRTIPEIKNVNQSFWKSCLEHRKVSYTLFNVIEYYRYKENIIDEDLITFIEDSKEKIIGDFQTIGDVFGSDLRSQFIVSFINTMEITNEKYREVIEVLKFSYKKFVQFKNVGSEKIEILVSTKVIRLSEENIIYIRDNYPEILTDFIVMNFKEHCDEILENELLYEEELIELVYDEIEDEQKIKIIEKIESPIDIEKEELTYFIMSKIVEKNFLDDNLKFVVSIYEDVDIVFKKIIEDICIEHYVDLINEGSSIVFELLIKLLNEDVEMNNRKELFVNAIANLTVSEVKECMKVLGMDNFLQSKRPSIENNSINQRMLDELKKKRLISTVTDDIHHSNYLRIYGSKLHMDGFFNSKYL
jgi:hypothetical protein